MKYCGKCGNQLLDEAVMCPKCGCAVAGNQPTAEQREKANKQATITVKIIAVCIILIAIIIAIKIQLG